ncbi:hypothetical protein TUM4438_41760 [Shewanella sairae]|uniref:OmpA-like domain-containing protein n=1 Tax=Shewanella sairae TaxID=190310 RepID=A0ABQ4PQR1_9GAMM|nr:OmpA family protein [Shewanella sairae]MCL1130382.1 DUF4892 domain-containing protein [Shewanella sairae]GIU51586.1 hypothetical protein TUM4438_41760 [Shewanella sairae]
MYYKILKVVVFFAVSIAVINGQVSYAATAADHPAVSRYQGATLKNSAVIHYQKVAVPISVVKKTKDTQLIEVIGKVSTYGYEIDNNRSTLEVGLNYKQVANKLGAEVLIDCIDTLCGYEPLSFYWRSWANINSLVADDNDDDTRFLVAKRVTDKGDAYYQWIITNGWDGIINVEQTIIEPEALLLDQVSVNISAPIGHIQTSLTTSQDDLEGSKDHPLLSRYQGAYITNYQQREFEKVVIATGMVNNDNQPTIEVEGKGTTIGYELTNSQSTLQIYQNYLTALKAANFEVLFSCSMAACGSRLLDNLYDSKANQSRFRPIRAANYPDSDFRFISAKLSHSNQVIYLMVVIDGAKSSNDSNKIVVDIVEKSEIDTTKVSIDPEYLNNEITQNGKVVLHGLNFAFNKAQLLPSSTASLTAIKTYLALHSKQDFYVVGHTDSVGSYEVNSQLSKARAQSVIEELVALNVDKKRLIAVGIGPVSPRSANSNDANKAENRRVELVLR